MCASAPSASSHRDLPGEPDRDVDARQEPSTSSISRILVGVHDARLWDLEDFMASIVRRGIATGAFRYDVRYRLPRPSPDADFPHTRGREAICLDRRGRHARGTWVDPREAGRRFGGVAQQWLDSNPEKRPSAWQDESVVRVHLLPAFGDDPIGKVTPDRVRALVKSWSTRYKPRTVRRMYGVLRAVFAYRCPR